MGHRSFQGLSQIGRAGDACDRPPEKPVGVAHLVHERVQLRIQSQVRRHHVQGAGRAIGVLVRARGPTRGSAPKAIAAQSVTSPPAEGAERLFIREASRVARRKPSHGHGACC